MLNNQELSGNFSGVMISTDETLIDMILEGVSVDEENLLDAIYASGEFEELDFGGNVKGITCRALLTACDSSPFKLRDLINLRKTKQNKELCEQIIELCVKEINSAAYIL